MLLNFWLDQSIGSAFVLLTAPFAGLCIALWLLTNLRRTRPVMLRAGAGMVPTYFTALSTLLALFTGFVANDAWERQRAASRVVQAERASARAVYDLSIASVSDMKEIRSALAGYLDAVIEREWPLMSAGGYASEASRDLGRLLSIVADPKITAEAGAVTHAALLDAVMALRAERGERLALSAAAGDDTKWITLLILAGLTLITLALVHLERPSGQATVFVTFSLAMVTTLGLIALHERPFDGPLAMSAEPLRIARASMDQATP